MLIFSYPSVLTYVLGAQKNRLIETVLLSTHNICFGCEIRKLNFCYALLTKVLALELSAKSFFTLRKYRLKILVEISVSTIQHNGNRKKVLLRCFRPIDQANLFACSCSFILHTSYKNGMPDQRVGGGDCQIA